jgi:hypothetical protein
MTSALLDIADDAKNHAEPRRTAIMIIGLGRSAANRRGLHEWEWCKTGGQAANSGWRE